MIRKTCMVIAAAGLLFFANGLAAQNPDRHLQDGARELFLRSAFAHGYIHGYEQGFHIGNEEYQAGHRQRPISQLKRFRSGKNDYTQEFGDKGRFEAGYSVGFDAGYGDAIGGREFRAVAALRADAPDLEEDDAAQAAQDGGFDRGFAAGYALGLLEGTRAGAVDADDDVTSPLCSSVSQEASAHPPGYCEGFRHGYALGYPDGYLSTPAAEPMQVTINAGAK